MNRGSHSVITTPSLDPYDPLHDPPPYTINNERHGAPHSSCPGRCWRQAAAGHEPDVYVVFPCGPTAADAYVRFSSHLQPGSC
jgi:hypothetical protein